MPKWLSGDERYMLEKVLLKFNNQQNYYAGYLWQNENVEYIEANTEKIVGPFTPNDSVQFFAPNNFDINFKFKSGFSYRAYPKLIEATANKIFKDTNSVYLNEPTTFQFKLNDTLKPHPIIEYIKQPLPPIIDYRSYSWSKKAKGSLQLNFDSDAIQNARYILLVDKDSIQKNQWLYTGSNLKTNIDTGKYYLTIVKHNWQYQQIEVHIKASKTYCLNIKDSFI